jgi:hypothetical protein
MIIRGDGVGPVGVIIKKIRGTNIFHLCIEKTYVGTTVHKKDLCGAADPYVWKFHLRKYYFLFAWKGLKCCMSGEEFCGDRSFTTGPTAMPSFAGSLELQCELRLAIQRY